MGGEGRVALRGLLAAQPGVHHVPEGAHLAVSHEAEDPHRVGAGAVGVVGLQQDADAGVGRVLGGRAQPPGGRRVGLLGSLVGGTAREDPDVGGAEVAGEGEKGADLGDDGLVLARRGDLGVARDAQDLDAGRLELGGDVGPFGGGEAGVDRFLGVGAQFDAVIAVRGREAQYVGRRKAGDTEGGERQLHEHRQYPALVALNPPRRSGVAHGSGASWGGGVAGRPGGRHPREGAVRPRRASRRTLRRVPRRRGGRRTPGRPTSRRSSRPVRTGASCRPRGRSTCRRPGPPA
ncbi:hypothetical protein SHIRM173S_11372 [Streptomyces hirsutus]